MYGYRTIAAVAMDGDRNVPGPPPEVLLLDPAALVVNEDYQRELSKSSLRMIRRMAAAWDWRAFKAPSVARTDLDGVYEVVDGQHTAIAAVTNGGVPLLPCLLSPADTLADKAAGFLGINRDRLLLSRAAVFAAQVASGDAAAIEVECALSEAACELVPFPPPHHSRWKVGQTLAVGTLMEVCRRRGRARLVALLRLLRHANAAPISSMSLKALDLLLLREIADDVRDRVMAVLLGQGVGRLEMIAKSKTAPGGRAYETLADEIAALARIPKRAGRYR